MWWKQANNMTGFALIIIILVLAIIISNIMLLKHSANLSLKNVKQDPIENAKKILEKRKSDEKGKKQADLEQ